MNESAPDKKTIGDVLTRARKKKGMKAEEVAALCNVTRGRYYQWEASDRILGKNIPPLAKALDLSEKYLRRINGKYIDRPPAQVIEPGMKHLISMRNGEPIERK